MLYRLFQPANFPQLYAIEEICFQPPLRFSCALMRKLTESTQNATWIAEEDGQLAGFAIVDLKAGSDRRAAYIQTIEVLPERRGQGIGDELLRRVESSARESAAKAIWLHVATDNSAAIRLYEAHGYSRQGREEHYYARHQPAFIYSKVLSPSVPSHG